MYKKIIVVLLVLAIVVCPYGETLAKSKAKDQEISFKKKRISLNVGQKKKLSVTKGKKINGKILFSSLNKKIAAVSKKGIVKAKKPGTVRILAKTKSKGRKAICIVKVEKYAKRIKMLADTIILYKNQTEKIQASVLPGSSAKRRFTYKVSKPSVASVSKDGVIKGKTLGTAKIELKSIRITKQKKHLKKTITVRVIERLPEATNPSIPSGNITMPPPTGSVPPSEPPKTLTERIAEIPSPPADQLLADTIVVNDNGDISTLYFLNKAYNGGGITIALNGKSTKQSASAKAILNSLETSASVTYNKAGTIRVSRLSLKEWWRITDIPLKQTYQLMAWEKDTVYGSPYGLIIMKGDTTQACKIY